MRPLTWQAFVSRASLYWAKLIPPPHPPQQWPSTRELDQDELYTIPGLSLPSSLPAQVFSSRNPKTVCRHFRWMREHHIAGVFLQRFLSGTSGMGLSLLSCLMRNPVEVKNGDDDMRRLRDEVLQLVRASAEAEGRVVSIHSTKLQKALLIHSNDLSGLSCTTYQG